MAKKIIIISMAVLLLAGAALWYFLRPPAEPATAYYIPGDYFVTNVKGCDRLLKTTVILELTRDDQDEYLAKHTFLIRDAIIFILRNKSEEQLRSTVIQDQLRMEIVAELEKQLAIDFISNILFNDFILQ